MAQLFGLLSTVISSDSVSSAAETTASNGGGMLSRLFGNSAMVIVLYCVVIFAIIWLMSKPEKKKREAQEKQRLQMKPGDPIVLKSGIYGTIVEVTAECFIVEFGTNRGVRVPMMKEAVARIMEPNLTDTPTVEPEPEKKGLFGRKKATPAQEAKEATPTEVTDDTEK